VAAVIAARVPAASNLDNASAADTVLIAIKLKVPQPPAKFETTI
jgi:hypothetical protein